MEDRRKKGEKKWGWNFFFFFFRAFMAENFLGRGERERERERVFHSRIPRQIRKRLFTLMRADKILRIPERRSLVGCNAVVSLVLPPPLPPSVFDMCVYREIIGAPSNRTKEWNLNDTRIILWAFICARIRIDRSIRFKLFHRTYYYLHAPISYILIIKTSIKT